MNPNAEVMELGVFHWHLSADEQSEPGLETKLPRIQHDIIEHLRKYKLKPNVFVFTGADALKSTRQKELLCRTILKELVQPEGSQKFPLIDKKCRKLCPNDASKKTDHNTPCTLNALLHFFIP